MLGSLVARMVNCCVHVVKARGGTQQMFIQGGPTPRSNPLPFYIPFFMKKVPLSYTFY